MLYEKLDRRLVRCDLCAHQCKIASSALGFCNVRQNIEGQLFTLAYAQAIAADIDPIEKKPLYHFLPGSRSYSIATMGCNFRCGFCQNWQISQISREDGPVLPGYELLPEEVVENAKRHDCQSISYTYTEPTIFFEYAYDTARLARANGLYNVFVTNGYMTRQALETIEPYLDAANVDLKSFSEAYYEGTCKARLQPVLDSAIYMKRLNIWVEVTTLLIPSLNDSDDNLQGIAGFIAQELGMDPPWHISRFYPVREFGHLPQTPMESLVKARDIGLRAGLRYVYIGNVRGGNDGADTCCYDCGAVVLRRRSAALVENRSTGGRCYRCGAQLDGVGLAECGAATQ